MDLRLTCRIILLFLLVSVLWAATLVVHYPDERHYSDGAWLMLDGGDWLTPHTPAGAVRLLKPPLAYWLSAGGMQLFGATPLGARIGFAGVGALTLLLVWLLARQFSRESQTPILAVAILASHVQFQLAAMRSMPDVLLCFAVTLALLGFAAIIIRGRPGWYWPYLAWLGIGLAAMSKGLLAVALAGYVVAFVLARGRHLPAGILRRVLTPGAVLLGVGVGAWWYILMLNAHGPQFLQAFWGDQVAEKTAGGLTALWQFPACLGIYVLNFLPWSLIGGAALWQRRRWPWQDAQGLLLLGWGMLIAVIFAGGEFLSLRYLLPATPALAVLGAVWLEGTTEEFRTWIGTSWTRLLLGVAGLLILIGIYLHLQIRPEHSTPASILLIAGGLAVALVIIWRSVRPQPLVGIATSVSLLWLVALWASSALLLPDTAAQMDRALRDILPQPLPVTVIAKPALGAKLRLVNEGRYEVYTADYLSPNLPSQLILLPSPPPPGWLPLARITAGTGDIKPEALWNALRKGNLRQHLRESRQTWWMAIPAPPTTEPTTRGE